MLSSLTIRSENSAKGPSAALPACGTVEVNHTVKVEGMKVRELMEALGAHDPDAEVELMSVTQGSVEFCPLKAVETMGASCRWSPDQQARTAQPNRPARCSKSVSAAGRFLLMDPRRSRLDDGDGLGLKCRT
jgi:hypothetical protein